MLFLLCSVIILISISADSIILPGTICLLKLGKLSWTKWIMETGQTIFRETKWKNKDFEFLAIHRMWTVWCSNFKPFFFFPSDASFELIRLTAWKGWFQLNYIPLHPESSTRNPESTGWNPQSKTVMDSLTWGEFYNVRKRSKKDKSRTVLNDWFNLTCAGWVS